MEVGERGRRKGLGGEWERLDKGGWRGGGGRMLGGGRKGLGGVGGCWVGVEGLIKVGGTWWK